MKLNIVLIIIIGILTFFLIFGHNGILKYRELDKIRQKYEEKITDTDKKSKELDDELRQVKNDKGYLEMLIKKNLNMKKPDEDVYILEHHDNPKPQQAEKPAKQAVKKQEAKPGDKPSAKPADAQPAKQAGKPAVKQADKPADQKQK